MIENCGCTGNYQFKNVDYRSVKYELHYGGTVKVLANLDFFARPNDIFKKMNKKYLYCIHCQINFEFEKLER